MDCIGTYRSAVFLRATHAARSQRLLRSDASQKSQTNRNYRASTGVGVCLRAETSLFSIGGAFEATTPRCFRVPDGWPASHEHLYARSLVWTVWEDQSWDVCEGMRPCPRVRFYPPAATRSRRENGILREGLGVGGHGRPGYFKPRGGNGMGWPRGSGPREPEYKTNVTLASPPPAPPASCFKTRPPPKDESVNGARVWAPHGLG